MVIQTESGFQCESTDTKPVLKPSDSGETLIEIDTKNVYIWHIDSWRSLT